jgi:hypothetical protein
MPEPVSPSPVSLDVLVERVDGVRRNGEAHEERDADRHREVLEALGEMRADGAERGRQNFRLTMGVLGLVAVAFLVLAGLAGVQLSGQGYGVSVGVAGAEPEPAAEVAPAADPRLLALPGVGSAEAAGHVSDPRDDPED